MKTEIIKQITIKLEKDDKEPIKKVIALANNLMNVGRENDCDCYKINNFYYEKEHFADLIALLDSLLYTETIELI